MNDELLRAWDVAVRLGYTTATIKRWAREGKLPGAVFINGGRHIRFDPVAIESFIACGGDGLKCKQNRPAERRREP
jgi:predicted DNA-binding transcriptional regulator AlpA